MCYKYWRDVEVNCKWEKGGKVIAGREGSRVVINRKKDGKGVVNVEEMWSL